MGYKLPKGSPAPAVQMILLAVLFTKFVPTSKLN